MNVLLVAEESAGIQTLRMLARTGHRIVGVLTAPPTRGGGATVASVAETLDVPVLPSKRVKDPELAGWMREREVDLLLNGVARCRGWPASTARAGRSTRASRATR